MRISNLVMGDRVGIETFEFPQNQATDNNLDHALRGSFHFYIRHPDVKALFQKIVAGGAI